ncbi:hypothetical protein LJR220_007043 [Bradyrhizobium sp. LjRoot220]|uniref:hypothetical protein n=1 Tax=Bradyrhizobium sp. LjRoot220 TaxID=3342284 RepID=UPI003ECF259F
MAERRFKQIDPLDKCLLREAERRWREARVNMFALERDRPARKREMETQAHTLKKGFFAPKG